MTALLLARLQFAFTIGFHILFPAITIGLGFFLVIFEACWLRRRDAVYKRLYQFWVKIFALGFGVGVVSGVVLSFQFGTNWGVFSARTGDVMGPLLSYEVLTAFFLEAGFLGVMLFGWQRVGDRVHFGATLMVALGSVFSAFWILAANSWMQTPAGYRLDHGYFRVVSWWQVIFNPSFPYRFLHMANAAVLATTFLLLGVSAWYLLKNRHFDTAKPAFLIALVIAAVSA